MIKLYVVFYNFQKIQQTIKCLIINTKQNAIRINVCSGNAVKATELSIVIRMSRSQEKVGCRW